MVAGIFRFCLVSSCKINHFGIKPERGGKPPRDRSVIRVIVERSGDLIAEIARELILVVLRSLKRRKVVRVIIIYKARLSCVRFGE